MNVTTYAWIVEQTLVYNHQAPLFRLLRDGYVRGTLQRVIISYKNTGESIQWAFLVGDLPLINAICKDMFPDQ